MIINIITLFPAMFKGVFEESILRRAIESQKLEIHISNLREYGLGAHRVVDDAPFGGGGGMILKPDPIADALDDLEQTGRVILTTPRGKLFVQSDAIRLSREEVITIICGHYEGVDERVTQLFVDEELSIGDYVLTGGEIPAMVISDAVTRLIPGVLGQDTLETGDSHYNGLLEHPHYTRPREFRGVCVPEMLLSGNHEQIKAWREQMSYNKTKEMRPDLLIDRTDAGTSDKDTGKD